MRGSRDAPENVLLAQMRILYAQLNRAPSGTPEYERVIAEIHALAVAYNALVTREKPPA
jgi:hypothetical protein